MRKFGLISAGETLVPLKDVSVEIQISGFVAHVIASLQYENNEDTPIEAEFVFPLDDGSAMYKFEAVIEDRYIVAECQEKEEANRTYNDAIAAGTTAMLLEEDDSTGDIFRCVVGNLPPKTHAKLVIGYVIELPVEHDGKLRFTLPVILNPRYSPNVGGLESAKGATYVLQQKDIPYSFKLSATVDGPKQIKSVTASQRHIVVERGENSKIAKVSFTDDFTFDSDVRLYVEYENPFEAECIVENGMAEKSGFLAERVLMVNLFTNIDTVGSTNKGEYIFVLDRSVSMGNKIQHAKQALILFLKSLPVGCYFNIVSFGSSHELLFTSGSKEYTDITLNTALIELQHMKADLGGTEILKPLDTIYAKDIIKGQPRQIILLTDGEVGNPKAVIDIVKKNSCNTRVFSIGIGEGASSALVNGVARAGNGKAEFIRDLERMSPKVISLLKFAMQPSITDVTIGWELPSGVNAITMPEIPPTLFNGDRLILYSLLQGYKETQISGKVFINGKTDKGPANFSATFFDDQSTVVSSFAPLHRLAAKAQIKMLEHKKNGSDEIKNQIIALSVASNMTSNHTSFVAVDKDSKERIIGKPIKANHSGTCVTHGIRLHVSSTILSRPRGRRTAAVTYEDEIYEEPDTCHSHVHLPVPPRPTNSFPRPTGRTEAVTEEEECYEMPDIAMACPPRLKRMSEIAPAKFMSDDLMMTLISLQGFRGNWTFSKDVCDILKTEIKALKELNLSQKDDVLATLAVLVWLHQNFSSRHDEWEMLETKANAWLMKEGLDEAVVRDAKNTIREALGSSMKI